MTTEEQAAGGLLPTETVARRFGADLPERSSRHHRRCRVRRVDLARGSSEPRVGPHADARGDQAAGDRGSSPISRTPSRTRGRQKTRRWPFKPACWPVVRIANTTSTASSGRSGRQSRPHTPLSPLGWSLLHLAAVTARFLPSARDPSLRSSPSVPTLVNPAAVFTPLPPTPHLLSSVPSTFSSWTVRPLPSPGPRRWARTATAPEATRFDARRDSLSDHDT